MEAPQVKWKRERKDFVKRMQDNLEEHKEIARRYVSERENVIGKENIASMQSSKEVAIQMLDHEEPKFRKAALEVIGMYWRIKPNELCVAKIEEISRSDTDIGVRGLAILILSSCFAGTDDIRIGKSFANNVINDKIPKQLRYASYLGLLRLRRKSILRIADFPDNIDYEYVRYFLEEDRIPNPVAKEEDDEGSVLSRWTKLRAESRARRED
jgi:hypothetical protein